MPEVDGPEKEPIQERQFMREKIVKQPISRRQIAKRALAFFFVAILFGVVAAVSFVVTKPFAQKYLGEESTEEITPITIPKDNPETMAQTLPPTQPVVEETEPIEDIFQSAMEKYQFSADDLSNLYGNLREIGQEADRGIVVVHSVRHQMDWFDNPVETTGLYAGAVIAVTKDELLILTPDAAVEAADSIKVTFYDGQEKSGTIKQTDRISGLAIVSVRTSDVGQDMLEEIKVLELGNSYAVKQGDLVIAIGSPAGIVHSTGYGFVSYVTRNVQVTDGITRVLYADLKGNAKTGTFLINLSGQLIGWVTDEYKNSGSEDMAVAMAISDYKGILQNLTNGKAAPYFGIKGQEVSAAMAESGLPQGVYVVNSIAESPAYNAGIQNGDIITKIGEKEITTIKEFQTQLEVLNSGEVVPVIIQRNGREEYKELEYQVTIGAR